MAEHRLRTTPPAVTLVPYGEDPLRALAELLLDQQPTTPLNLRGVVVLFPHYAALPRFRRVLLDVAAERGIQALIPPHTQTLAAWLRTFLGATRRPIGSRARELLLLEALAEHPGLTRRWGTWPLVDSLLSLFDEMTLHQAHVPEDLPAFARMLAKGYGIPDPPPTPLSDEAHLAHTLWTAWREQLAAAELEDSSAATVTGLGRSLEQLPQNVHIYLAGFVLFNRLEQEWIKALQARAQLTLVLHGQTGSRGYHPDTLSTRILEHLGTRATPTPSHGAYTRFLDAVFDLEGGDMLTRARRQSQAQPSSPVCNRLVIHDGANFEAEARAIEVQVRCWRLQGLRHIGIVTNDRKLARRVRALLERANVLLDDAAGWALSTTSAATALMRWLECLEHDFAYAPLLDLLKSPFTSMGLHDTHLDQAVTWLEEGVILHHNVVGGLERYRQAALDHREGLDKAYAAGATDALCDLFDLLTRAARPLTGLLCVGPRFAGEYLRALKQSLEILGLIRRYREDEAGSQLLLELDEMQAALAGRALRMRWAEFRDWLRRNLERSNFEPPLRGGEVELMSFAQSRLYRFDGVIIAGALRDHLPGQIDSTPFFNEGTRRQLDLPSLMTRRQALLHDFRRLLEAAPRVVITLRREHQGEPAIASPWVERLRVFHDLAYHRSLDDPTLAWLASSPATQITWPETKDLPTPQGHPSPTLPKALIADTLSASAHQRMLDCPYQYYAADGLRLGPVRDVREQLEKMDYGLRIHRILQAFHIGVPTLPGPFRKALNPDTRAEAEDLLWEIGQAVFARDIQNSIFARGWLFAWQSSIRPYLNWQLQRTQTWRASEAELNACRRCSDNDTTVTLTARIDRVDRGDDGHAIIDYKTGRIPALAEVEAGEHIQLPFYVLALERPVHQALFLGLTGAKISDRVRLERKNLDSLVKRVRARLLSIQQSLNQRAGLPAWGDDLTCARCAMQGLCRKQMWLDQE